jgi:ABC-2 type transport system ATP-binding protein
MSIIKVEKIVKRFGDYTAVDNLSFNVEKGRIFGILGPNGAGKTTTIRMLTNILIPDEGSITMFGEPINSSFQDRMGYLPEERGLYKKIKVIDQLSYFGQLKGLTRSRAIQLSREWLKKMDASDWENKKIQELSKGMQQKVQFISTILHEPEILILDEPFSGFDPINTELLKTIIIDMKKAGKTILLSTHVMEQVEQMCDDICLIYKGKTILNGKVRDIKSSYGNDTLIIEFDGDDSFFSKFNNIKFINRTANRAEFRIGEGDYKAKDILRAAMENAEVSKFELVEPSLNEIFIDVVSKVEVK